MLKRWTWNTRREQMATSSKTMLLFPGTAGDNAQLRFAQLQVESAYLLFFERSELPTKYGLGKRVLVSQKSRRRLVAPFEYVLVRTPPKLCISPS